MNFTLLKLFKIKTVKNVLSHPHHYIMKHFLLMLRVSVGMGDLTSL